MASEELIILKCRGNILKEGAVYVFYESSLF
jgi:hypothetical protein